MKWIETEKGKTYPVHNYSVVKEDGDKNAEVTFYKVILDDVNKVGATFAMLFYDEEDRDRVYHNILRFLLDSSRPLLTYLGLHWEDS